MCIESKNALELFTEDIMHLFFPSLETDMIHINKKDEIYDSVINKAKMLKKLY